ncbi:MAG: hypothetical protein GX857_07685 [Bacteroidales bacterium]|jgi:hypothetical protein|nr:hypothetical protein [Bacteroidales bacterium]
MQKTIFIIFISVLSHSIVIGQTDSIAQKKIYLVLDRNSPNVEFTEMKKKNDLPSDWHYLLNTNIKEDFIYQITFTNICAPLLNRFDVRKKVPISFIDSIAYMDEKQIREAYYIDEHEFHWEKIENKKIYLIDIGTLQNDSLMMYEVGVRFYGFLE